MSVIFFDIDGTILGPTSRISDPVIQAIHDTQKKGHDCLIASGRPKAFIAQNVQDIAFDGYILANGTHVLYQNRTLFLHTLKEESLIQLIKFCEERNLEYIMSTDENGYLDTKCTYLYDFYARCNIDFDKLIGTFSPWDIINKTVKVEIYYKNKENYKDLRRLFDNDFFLVNQENTKVLEVSNKDYDKSTAINEILDYLHISRNHSYCFGDGENDLGMFETVGHGIAMDNAIAMIKEKAEKICESVEEDGVAKELNRLF